LHVDQLGGPLALQRDHLEPGPPDAGETVERQNLLRLLPLTRPRVRPRLLTGLRHLSSLRDCRRCRDGLLSRLWGLRGLRDGRGRLVAVTALVGPRPTPTARCDLEVVVLVLRSLRSERIRSSTADVTVSGRAALGGVQWLLLGPEDIEGSRGAITGRDGRRLALERLDRRCLGHGCPAMIHGQRLEVLEQLLSLDARQLADLARREVRQILVGGHALPGALGDLLELVLHPVISEAGAERPLRERVAPTDDLEAAQLHIASLRL